MLPHLIPGCKMNSYRMVLVDDSESRKDQVAFVFTTDLMKIKKSFSPGFMTKGIMMMDCEGIKKIG